MWCFIRENQIYPGDWCLRNIKHLQEVRYKQVRTMKHLCFLPSAINSEYLANHSSVQLMMLMNISNDEIIIKTYIRRYGTSSLDDKRVRQQKSVFITNMNNATLITFQEGVISISWYFGCRRKWKWLVYFFFFFLWNILYFLIFKLTVFKDNL